MSVVELITKPPMPHQFLMKLMNTREKEKFLGVSRKSKQNERMRISVLP